MAGGFSPINSRKLPIIIGLVAMAVFTFVAAETPSNVVAVGYGYLGRGVLRRWRKWHVLGSGFRRCTGPLHGILGFHPEFRRVFSEVRWLPP
jgi:uncharacterized protein (DUF1810 family)